MIIHLQFLQTYYQWDLRKSIKFNFPINSYLFDSTMWLLGTTHAWYANFKMNFAKYLGRENGHHYNPCYTVSAVVCHFYEFICYM